MFIEIKIHNYQIALKPVEPEIEQQLVGILQLTYKFHNSFSKIWSSYQFILLKTM